ncbi:MAG: SDR family oxidoreductase [Gemmatimonadetes bacterium]|nr:SDR family oxidoreductase [Gemmatimonadota bacterium]
MTTAEPRGSGLIDLSGRNAVVTGGSRGIGRATAELLARAGADVGISYRRRGEDARAVVAALTALGARAWCEAGDLAHAEDARALFERADREFDGLDIVVGNAGVWAPEDVAIEAMDDARWRLTLAANLDSTFHTCREAAARLRPGGALVLVSSTAGQRGEAFHADYAATKGAVIAMVKGLCVELAPRGVTVNCVAPGWVDTEMAEPAFGSGGRDRIARSIPLGRIATAADIAGPIVFLCTPLARHITGEILNVNGGSVLVG